jgi:photosystem II stability/assembly factor-like uncharacterized protein
MSIVPDQRDRNVAYLISLRQVDELTSRRELYVTRTGGAFWRRLDGVVDGEQAISGIVTHGRRQAYLGLGFPGALLHTRNGGITWHDVTRGFDEPPTYIQPLAVASDEPRTLYIAAGTERSRSVNLFVSGNSGRTWTFAPTGIARGCCCGSALAPSQAHAYVTTICPNTPTSPGLLETVDGGQSWRALSLDLTFLDGFIMDPSDPGTLYAANGHPISNVGLRKSTDGVEPAHSKQQSVLWKVLRSLPSLPIPRDVAPLTRS